MAEAARTPVAGNFGLRPLYSANAKRTIQRFRFPPALVPGRADWRAARLAHFYRFPPQRFHKTSQPEQADRSQQPDQPKPENQTGIRRTFARLPQRQKQPRSIPAALRFVSG